MSHASIPETIPQWFTDALAAAPRVGSVMVGGSHISYRIWGDAAAQPAGAEVDLLLVHGGGANAHWWDHLAPALVEGRRVVALDLSGHGDSDHRASYSLDGWADELAAVIDAEQLAGPPIVVGHSLGGMVTTILARRGVPALAGAIIIDSPIEPMGAPPRAEADPTSFGNARVCATEHDAVARFRPVPAQPVIGYIAQHISRASVREVAGGWGWKFDPGFIGMHGELPRTLEGLLCPVALIAGQRGILSEAARRARAASDEVEVLKIPDAGHAIMLDQPFALLRGIRSILARFAPSDAQRF